MTAADLIVALEDLSIDDPSWETRLSAARTAVDVALHDAAARLTPDEIAPVSVDTLELYRWHIQRLPVATYATALASLHRRALRTHPGFAAICRSVEAIADVEYAARSTALHVEDQHLLAGERAVAEYRLQVARALVDVGDPLASVASAYLAAVDLGERLRAIVARRDQALVARAEQLRLEHAARQRAIDEAQDAAAAERELEALLRTHGLPPDLRAGFYVDSQLARCRLLATARRRLSTTPVDSIRLSLGHGRGLYSCRELARGIGEASLEVLQSMLDVLDRAELEMREESQRGAAWRALPEVS